MSCDISDEEPHTLTSVTKLKYKLSCIIEPDFGLGAELVRLNVLSVTQYCEFLNQSTVERRSAALLYLLTSENQCLKFLEALERNEQRHVTNFIEQNGGQQITSLSISFEYDEE